MERYTFHMAKIYYLTEFKTHDKNDFNKGAAMIVRTYIILGGLIWTGITFGSYEQDTTQKVLVINNAPEEVIVSQWEQFGTTHHKTFIGTFPTGRQHTLLITAQAFISISSQSFGQRIIQLPIHPTTHTITISQQFGRERYVEDNLGNAHTVWKKNDVAAKIINAWRAQP